MASDPGLASAQERSSSGHRLQGHSLCQNRPEHEVFLSHSGMQKPFVHDLYKEFLKVPRFQFNKPFFDVQDASLPKGEEWKDRLIKAARNCKVAVLILTEDFLTSLWPMLELLHFIDAQKTDNPDMKLLPIFFDDLLPSHLSDQVIKDCWKVEWERIIGTESSVKLKGISLTVELCQEALRTLKDFNGIKARSFKSFELLREDIVSKVLEHLPSGFDPEIDPDIEGCRRLCDMISQLFQEDDGGRQCLGLYGMGGSGKTTMCKALCSYFGPSFNHRVYHLQMGSNDCKKSEKNLFKRHKELLRKLLGLSEEEINRIQNPRQTLKMHLGQRPVFLAVDDVRDDTDSCREVWAYVNYLCSGSKIIITARSRIIVESVIGPKYCYPIPNLNKEEALSLFLKISAPERILTSLDGDETKVLQDCLQICFFSLEEGGSRNSSSLETGDKSDNPTVPTKVGHYHPLALRAVASYFRDQYSKLGSIAKCALELRNKKKLLFSSDATNRIFDILGFGFHEICHLDKQLFIDVALYAPRWSIGDDDEYIFTWLVDIHVNLSPDDVHLKLQHLRKMSFLDYEDSEPGNSACKNIRMHDLYREYAKRLINEHEKDDSYRFGVYNNHWYQAPPVLASTGWAKAPRVRLKRWEDVVNEKEWCNVAVIHLTRCETITTFSIGHELVNLRELKIDGCSKLEELRWTPDIITERLRGVKLCFVELSFNKSLKILPDFNDCSELRKLAVIECSSAEEPLHFYACLSLQLLHIEGKNAPEVRSLQSCLKLRSVCLAWKASWKGLLVHDLPSLSKLVIIGPSVLPIAGPAFSDFAQCMPRGHSLFCQHYPKETVCYELTGVAELTNLETLHLNFVPLGCLPKGLGTIGSSLQSLNLDGCLLSQLVDFSEFSNLVQLSITQTNVKELRGVRGLKKLKLLDCSFNFRLQKIPDLRPLPILKCVVLYQCPELQAIPRLPPSCCQHKMQDGQRAPPGFSLEDCHRGVHAAMAFANTTKSVIPSLFFAFFRGGILESLQTSRNSDSDLSSSKAAPHTQAHPSNSSLIPETTPHHHVGCDGCNMLPLIGPRYKAKGIKTTLSLCTNCFSNKCDGSDCGFTGNTVGDNRILNRSIVRRPDYDLCHACFIKYGCDERDFYLIHQTIS